MSELASVNAIKDVLRECPICTEHFDDDSHMPRRMPCCVQSICESCLETYCKGRQIIPCPLCRHQHNLPGGVKSLPKERLILKFLEHLKVQKGIRLPCTDCPDNEAATVQCMNCGLFLCSICLNAHTRNKVTRKHRTVTFEEMKGLPRESLEFRHQCFKHELPLQFYCYTCRLVICVSCTVLEHDKGNGHNVVSITAAHHDIAHATDDTLVKLDEKVEKLSGTEADLKQKLVELELSKKAAKDSLDKRFDKILKEVQDRRRILLSHLEDVYSNSFKLTNEALESTKQLRNRVKSSLDYTRQIRSRADQTEDLQIMTSSAASFTKMLQESHIEIQYTRTGVGFVPANMTHLSSAIQGAGLIRSVAYFPTHRPVYVPGADGYNAITLTPAEFQKVDDVGKTISSGDKAISCPLLEWDCSTASDDITVSDTLVTNEKPKTPPQDTGCRIRSWRRLLTSRPLVIRGGSREMFLVKVSFSLKQVTEKRSMVFETAMTANPADTCWNQSTGLSVRIIGCPKHKHKLCLWVRFDGKLLVDIPIACNQIGEAGALHLGFLLDGRSSKVYVVDLDNTTVIQSVTEIVFDRPFWVMAYLDASQDSNMTCELVSGHNLTLSEGMTQLLLSL
ncbi:E3 ubiquitin-protein ligase TRIM71-like [Haliotis cracherodii]|uniref:E3 ubiquitin-protein ligase TRIM71-like n=1 Tax=Haliotis cracherodii TaxID=6455 RepID=UPI0039E77A65